MKQASIVDHMVAGVRFCPIIQNDVMKILHIISSFNIGGMENFVIRLAFEQKKMGHTVGILAIRNGDLWSDASNRGILTLIVGEKNIFNRILTVMGFIRGFKPDIVNAHNVKTLKYAALASKLSGSRAILTHHGLAAGHTIDPNQKEWEQIDVIVTVSEAVLRQMDSPKLSPKTQVITNGIQFERATLSREQVRATLSIPEEKVVAIIVARIDELKGHDTLIKALSLLKERSTSMTMLIVGDGSQRAAREKLSEDLGLGSSEVQFLGFRKDIPDLLAASDFFVLPSLTEGLPLSILEAMSHGLPTVATNVGGIPELITPDVDGFLVPVEAPEALAKAMQCLVQDPELRRQMGKAAIDRIKLDFSFDTMAGKYESLYKSIAKR